MASRIRLVLRLLYLFHLRDRLVDGDGAYYHLLANMVATGKGFVYPTPGRLHYVKSAVHPPLWTLTLALFDRLGMHSWLSHQVVAAFVGTATIIATGYAGRRIATVLSGGNISLDMRDRLLASQ